MEAVYHNRCEAGQALAGRLRHYAGTENLLVLGLARGGLPVAREIARVLDAELDVLVIRKIGVPGHEELALGALSSSGVRVLNQELVAELGLSDAFIDQLSNAAAREAARREQLYRGARPPPQIAGRSVILVDDGLATGASMWAAVETMRRQQAARIIVAVPLASSDVCQALTRVADEVVCTKTLQHLRAISLWYHDFHQISDAEVQQLLRPIRPLHPA